MAATTQARLLVWSMPCIVLIAAKTKAMMNANKLNVLRCRIDACFQICKVPRIETCMCSQAYRNNAECMRNGRQISRS